MHETDPEIIDKKSERELRMNVIEIAPLGYGNPDSSISLDKKLETGQFTKEIIEKAVEAITSGEMMKPVDNQDDGCIDGRTAILVEFIKNNGLSESVPFDNSNHERSKIAGGGYMTALAMFHAISAEGNIEDNLKKAIEDLASKEVYCGAHTGEHRKDDDDTTDCGANDKLRTVFENGVRFSDEIKSSLSDLLKVAGLELNSDLFKKIISGWADKITDDEYFGSSTGQSRLGIIKDGIAEAQIKANTHHVLAVSKDLEGSHNEAFIVINFIENETFSQAKFRTYLQETFPNAADAALPQAFVVDVPRIIKIATALSETNAGMSFEEALYAGVTYQLATAATLTDGTLRNFVVS